MSFSLSINTEWRKENARSFSRFFLLQQTHCKHVLKYFVFSHLVSFFIDVKEKNCKYQ